ncbi:hypothetical protein HAX54_006792 [Datura stramonium]|uniref:Uncharacterized protein n=1 Tax=Datura stramonium TaxID=4076 RepID=A0ABS8WY14_DATST|nr:hypothetical protein [Datura stramonium]
MAAIMERLKMLTRQNVLWQTMVWVLTLAIKKQVKALRDRDIRIKTNTLSRQLMGEIEREKGSINSKIEIMLERISERVVSINLGVRELKYDLLTLTQTGPLVGMATTNPECVGCYGENIMRSGKTPHYKVEDVDEESARVEYLNEIDIS